jgi:hypothetical protein
MLALLNHVCVRLWLRVCGCVWVCVGGVGVGVGVGEWVSGCIVCLGKLAFALCCFCCVFSKKT